MPRLQLALLGPPRVERDSAPIQVDTRKAIALLAYLALAGESGAAHGRDSLAALFWPDVDQPRAHGALRRTLSALNKALGGWLRIERDLIAFERDADAHLDVDEFNARLAETRTHGHPPGEVCPACLGLLAAAAALYHDDFMAGFSLRDSPGFDDWQFFQAEACRRQLASALERLVGGLPRFGADPAEARQQAITYARRWLALDPLHEPAHRQLMLLYAWTGQRTAALRQYRECVRILNDELGVEPLPETTSLYEAIRENRAPAPPMPEAAATPAPGAAPAPAPASTPYRLVGRAAEWQALLAAYATVRPDGRLVVLEGEAGIGKTRLAETFWQQVRAQDGQVLIARCYEGETNLAYGPFVEGLRAVLDARQGAGWAAPLAPHSLVEAGRLLPELAASLSIEPAPALDGPGAQSRFFEGLRQVLLAALQPEALAGPPGVIVIDDAQWIDEASLDLLTYLVRRWRGQPLCLVVTWRPEQVAAGHRLRQLLAEALRAGAGVHLTLRRLSLPAVIELVTQASAREAGGQPPPRAIIERLYQETEGLPFFVVEYLNALPADHSDWSLPGSVRTILQARLARVDETGWQLLTAAAVIGRSFEFDTLHAASGRTDDETVAGLEALMAAGLINELNGQKHAAGAPHAAPPAYDFSHEKLRALVYEETSLARRRLLHRRVAEALAGRARRAGAPSAAASQIAYHYQQAGHEAEAAEHYRLAGEHARGLYANAEALAHFRAALALGHPAAALLHEAIGDLLTLSGLYDAALTSFERAAALAEPAALPALEHKLGSLYHRLGDWDLAESQFQSALAALGADPAPGLRARLHADWSLTAHHRGNTPRALDLAQQALVLAEAARDRRALAQAHNILGILTGSQGQPDQARRHLEQSLALAEALNDPASRVAALNNLALARGQQNEPGPAIQLLEQALELARAQGDRHREAALLNNLADLLHASGQVAAAQERVKQSVTLYAEIGAETGTAQLQPEIWKLAEW